MREVQDHWFREAKKQGYRSRAAFKLIEIDERRKLLRPGMRVLDCGAAPGSWAQVAARKVGPKGRVVAVDLKEIDRHNMPENVELVTGDLLEFDALAHAGGLFDLVLSDMAPDTTGDPMGDHHQSARLCEALLDRTPLWLRPGGDLVMKVFEGAVYPDLLKRCQRMFEKAKGFKPKASRSESVEMFIVCQGLRPEAAEEIRAVELPKRRPSRGWGAREGG